jgi:hypothetical protein
MSRTGEKVDLLQLSLYVLLSELGCHRTRGIPKPRLTLKWAGEWADERHHRVLVVRM